VPLDAIVKVREGSVIDLKGRCERFRKNLRGLNEETSSWRE
jgi:hypothetical protein